MVYLLPRLADGDVHVGLPPMILPSPPPFGAGQVTGWAFTLYAGGAAVLLAAAWALHMGIRRRDWLPATLISGGLVCSFVEPMLDILGHLRWANDLPMFLYTNFGIPIPLLIPFAYAAFFGLEPYFWYLVFRAGATVRQVFLVFAVAALSDIILETPAVQLRIWEYYGVQPYRVLGFPWWWSFINGFAFITVGALIWYLEPRLGGWRRLWLLAVPTCGMMGAYFTVGWPHMLAINSTLPTPIKWVATTVTMLFCLVGVRCIAHFVAVAEPSTDWTFRRLLVSRLLPPGRRERVLGVHPQRWTQGPT